MSPPRPGITWSVPTLCEWLRLERGVAISSDWPWSCSARLGFVGDADHLPVVVCEIDVPSAGCAAGRRCHQRCRRRRQRGPCRGSACCGGSWCAALVRVRHERLCRRRRGGEITCVHTACRCGRRRDIVLRKAPCIRGRLLAKATYRIQPLVRRARWAAVEADDPLARSCGPTDACRARPVAAYQRDLIGVKERHPLLDRGLQRLLQSSIP